jgi:hypothetical protein
VARIRKYLQKLTAPLAAVVLAIALSLSLAASASASNSNVSGKVITASGQALAVRSGPGTNYPFIASVKSGDTVWFNCYENGTTVAGPYGREAVWDRLDSGGFVSDAWIFTGRNSAVVPPCGPGGAGCYSASCVGKNPGTEGCLADAAEVTQYYTATKQTPDIDIWEPGGRITAVVYEYHSNACNAAWFEFGGRVDANAGDLAKLSAWNPKGPSQHFTYFVSNSGRLTAGASNMVDDETGATACVGAQVYYEPSNVEVYYKWEVMHCR